MTTLTPIPKPHPDRSSPEGVALCGLSRRAWTGLILLTLSTVGILALAWMWPDQTQMHFWLVAQGLPIFYWLLVWWWAREPVRHP